MQHAHKQASGRPACAQALFRPVSMAVPDLALICEIMLMAEGFQQSKTLARKFIILYKLCEDLLSKARCVTVAIYLSRCCLKADDFLCAEKFQFYTTFASPMSTIWFGLAHPPAVPLPAGTTTGSCVPSRRPSTWLGP